MEKGQKIGKGRKRLCARAPARGPRSAAAWAAAHFFHARLARSHHLCARLSRSRSCACAQVSAPRGRGNGALASRSLVHPPGARPLRACAGESGSSGCRLRDDSSCQSVGRSSRRPSPSLFSRGGAAKSAPGIPQWGRSGDGGNGLTEPERERPRGTVPRGGHGRPSPRPQPGRHRPICPAGESAAPQPRAFPSPPQGSGVAVHLTCFPGASSASLIPLGDPRPFPGRGPRLGRRPLLHFSLPSL